MMFTAVNRPEGDSCPPGFTTVNSCCIVRDVASEVPAEDDSLAENMQRIALHLLDQFRAFAALR